MDRRFRCRAPARLRALSGRIRARDEDIERGRRAGLGGGALRSARAGRVHSLPAARGHRARGTPRSRARRGGACAPSAWDVRGVFLVARGGPPESSRVESRYREALFVTIRTTRGRWLLPRRARASSRGVTARDDQSPGPRDRPDHADEPPEEEDARDGPASVSSGEACGALPPRLVGNRFGDLCRTRYRDAAVLPRRERHRRLVAGVGAGRTHRGDGDARRRARRARDVAFRRRGGGCGDGEGKKADGGAAFATFAWDDASRPGLRPFSKTTRAYARSANDDDGATVHAEEEGIHDERGDRDGDDEDLEDLLTESEYADDEDAFGDPFAASYRRDRSRFADARDDASVSSFSSASVMAASERTQSARLGSRSGSLHANASLNDERSGFGSGGTSSRRRERTGPKPSTRFPRATEPDETRVARLRASPGLRLVPRLVSRRWTSWR